MFPLVFVDSTLEASVTAVPDVSGFYDAETQGVSYLLFVMELYHSIFHNCIFVAVVPDF